MQYDNKVMGEVIRKMRRKKGWSQEVLSGLAGIPRSHLAMIETGYMSPKVETLWKIAEALEIKLSDIVRRVEEET